MRDSLGKVSGSEASTWSLRIGNVGEMGGGGRGLVV